MFIDLVTIDVKSGSGGNGVVAWRREKFVPRGGPAGGDGGNGGNVILQADNAISTLLEFKYKSSYEAENGHNGKPKNCHGKNGKDLVIRVPEGTLVKDKNSGLVIADLCLHGQQVMVAAGGRGGRGNARFVSSVKQSPQFCEPGEPCVCRTLELELKLLADVGLVGLPNAGKSTLISTVSAARPKIADYPFTTLIPNLGVVKTPERDGIVFADIPGLIEGSSDGAGLGHQFLRHVERTRLLIHMLDILEPDPVKNYRLIRHELEKYSDHLSTLEEIIAINKIDASDQQKIDEVQKALEGQNKRLYAISAATKQGVNDLLNHIFERIKLIPRELQTVEVFEDPAAFDNDDSDFTVYRRKNAFFVDGGKVKRLVNVTDLRNSEAIYRLQNILRSMGVFKALKQSGASNGDVIIIDRFEFDYFEDDNDLEIAFDFEEEV